MWSGSEVSVDCETYLYMYTGRNWWWHDDDDDEDDDDDDDDDDDAEVTSSRK